LDGQLSRDMQEIKRVVDGGTLLLGEWMNRALLFFVFFFSSFYSSPSFVLILSV
jgi:hypothetical protein